MCGGRLTECLLFKQLPRQIPIYLSVILLFFPEGNVLQATRGATLRARAATGAFFVINRCEIVYDLDCAVRAGLFAFFTTDAGVFASLARVCALVLAAAHHNGAGVARNQGDHVLRANA